MARGAIAYKGQLYLGGSKVEANPTGSAEGGNLSKLGVDDTVYAIPQVNNGTLTIQKNGTNVATFSANQSKNVTANIDVSEDIAGTQTVSGNPITLTDCAPINAESLVVELEPIQEGSGDPSPTNIRPITGYTECEVDDVGKNFLDTSTTTKSGITFTEDANGYITASPNNADGRNWGYSYCQYTDIELEAGTYNLDWWASTLSSSQYKAICVFDTSDNMLVYAENFGESGTSQFTLSEKTTVGVEAKILDSVVRIQIRENTSPQTYSSYHSSNATIQFGQTVYGGRSNFTEGGTDDEFENLDDFTDVGFHANQGGTNAYEVYIETPNKKYGVDNLIANEMPVKTTFTDVAEFSIRGFNNGSEIAIKFPKSIVNTQELAKQWCIDNGLQIVYEKATPTTISTPPTDLKLLKGVNNLTTNGTTINLGYQPDNVIGEAIKASEEYTDRRMDALGDLAYIDEDGDNSTKFLRGDGTWQNTPAGATTLAGLTDTNISSPSNGQVLKYNGSKWVNSADYSLPKASAGTLGGVKVGANLDIDSDGVLSATGGGGASALNDLTDVSAASPSNKQVLAYDSSQSKWVAVDADVVAIPRSYWSSTTRELDFMITVPAYNTQRILKFSLMHNAGLAASEYMLVLDRGSVYSSKLAGDTCAISSSYLSSTNTYTITISMPSVSGGQNFVFAMTMYNGSGKTW